MTKLLLLLGTMAFSASLFAQELPRHYPPEGFQRTGLVDAIYADEGRIVINDITYQYSMNVVVHSMSSYRVPLTRVQSGAHVGYKMGTGGTIVELWLLPLNYKKAG